jgi:hypothetical protein
MKTIIFQTSPTHTASTFLINALYGLIPHLSDTSIVGVWDNEFLKKFDNSPDNTIVIKTHNTNIDDLILKYSGKYKLYFICSQRPLLKKFIDVKYHSYPNVVIFNFIEINETLNYKVPQIIKHIHNKIKKMLNIELNINSGINRIVNMNKRYTEISTKPFNYIDDFFEIHGSHRNRK